MTNSQLLGEILQLQPRARRALIHDAIDSLPDEFCIDPDLTATQAQSLDRRLADYLENPSKGRSWEQVDARVQTTLEKIRATRTSRSFTPKRSKSSSKR